MGMVLPFFARQTVVGVTEYLSEPYDVSQFESVNLELRIQGLIGASPTVVAQMLTAAELSSSNWYGALTFVTVSAAPTIISGSLDSTDMSQFVKAKITVAGTGPGVTCSLIGVAREAGA